MTVDRIINGTLADRDENTRTADDPFAGPPVRCPNCGGLVFMPCVACRDRKAMEARGRYRRIVAQNPQPTAQTP